MTLPAQNDTLPTEPRSFTVTPLSGMINGTWLPPIVRPSGTRFEVIAATTSADASVGTVAWSGDSLNASIPWTNADSLTFWWVRAVANSRYSAYEPNTYGLLAIPARSPDNTLLSRPVPDPDFRSGLTIGSYWFTGPPFPTDAGSLSTSGGITDGSGCMTIVGSTGLISVILAPDHRSIPGNRYSAGEHPISPGQRVAYQLGFRRTTALAGSGGLAGFGFAMGIKKTVGASDYSITFGGFIRCDTLALSEWTYVSSSFVVPNSGWDRLQTNIGVGVANLSSGTIQIGRYDVTVSGV